MALKAPKADHDWVFSLATYPLGDFYQVAAALRAIYVFLDDERETVYVSPEDGHENATWEICKNLLGQPARENLKRIRLAKFRELSKGGPVVHTMDHGWPACGFTNAPQAKWPENHNWTRPEDLGDDHLPRLPQVGDEAA